MTKNRNYVNMQVNPCKMCMPMGASQALKGFANTMNIIHGSQGCSTYIRRHMAAHYNEPVDIASSSLTEEGTVYGGAKNLQLGIKNLVSMYNPEIVGVLTTCLAETIGDDIYRIVKEIREYKEFENVDIIPIPTPGYGGSQSEGYFAAIKGILEFYSKKSYSDNVDLEKEDKKRQINVIVSNATCEDIREIKRIATIFNVEFLILPDISNVFDAPFDPNYKKLCNEGVKRDIIYKAFTADATIELGQLVRDEYSPARFLFDKYEIPMFRMPLPIGMRNMDTFINTIASIIKKDIPIEIGLERGRLLDGMIDSHKHCALGRVAVFGDMDLVFGISSLMVENGVELMLCATGSRSKNFRNESEQLFNTYGLEVNILEDSDFETIRDIVLKKEVNLMIGPSDGKFILEKDGIDLIRVGFPVHDHIGAQRKLRFGYKGSIRLLDEVVNKLLDQKHLGYKDRMIEMYYQPTMNRKEELAWQLK